MGRGGFTDDGGASIMDWLIDSVESSIDSVEKVSNFALAGFISSWISCLFVG